LLVAGARVYIAARYPSDVLVGLPLGGIVAMLLY
jgi:membrane-associated phospholipid phosphatase